MGKRGVYLGIGFESWLFIREDGEGVFSRAEVAFQVLVVRQGCLGTPTRLRSQLEFPVCTKAQPAQGRAIVT